MVIKQIKDLINVADIFKVKEKIILSRKKLPKHVALTTHFESEENVPIEDSYKKKLDNIINIIKTNVLLNIPMISFEVMNEQELEYKLIDPLVEFFKEIASSKVITKNQIKITVLGKWYDLPGRLVEEIKKTVEATKDFDKFFLNICINYDGQEEIVDAMRLIGMQVRVGKVDPTHIDKQLIKENLYTSQLLPPGLIIKTGEGNKLGGFLLWDSANANVYYSQISWLDFDKTEFFKALETFQK
tara:strand:+ start:257 stop:985 length:729 start_codon:yes stop_codon:yes gene_type:complete